MDRGYPLHLIDLLAKLYRKQHVTVKVAEHYRCQNGFVLRNSPTRLCPFSLLVQHPSRDGDQGDFDGFQGGLQFRGRIVTNLRYADDIIPLATSGQK